MLDVKAMVRIEGAKGRGSLECLIWNHVTFCYNLSAPHTLHLEVHVWPRNQFVVACCKINLSNIAIHCDHEQNIGVCVMSISGRKEANSKVISAPFCCDKAVESVRPVSPAFVHQMRARWTFCIRWCTTCRCVLLCRGQCHRNNFWMRYGWLFSLSLFCVC